MTIFTRTIWILSLVSLFMDIAGEMLYPVLPLYLKEIGFSILLIGLLEGIAEATAGLSKSYFGKLSDLHGSRVPFVKWGYLLSAFSKPLMAVLAYPLWVFAMRTMDRLGKGIRTGARDAMLSQEASHQTKGRVFGFHRAMDTLGAAIGPLFALLFLSSFPKHYKTLFVLAFIPGILAVMMTWWLTDKSHSEQATEKTQKTPLLISFTYWRESPSRYRRILAGLLFFTLFNSSDFFLLLCAREAGLSDVAVIGVYILYNIVYAAFAYPLGSLADRIGFRKTLVLGFLIFASVYAGMAFTKRIEVFYGLFVLYGIYAAATEGTAKAWITNICPARDTATAIGTYTGFQSIGMLIASSLAGWLWIYFGLQTTFLLTASASLLVVLYLFFNKGLDLIT